LTASRGALYFHRLFSVQELGFGNPEPVVGPLIRHFLKIGEAVAGRWIEMPNAILLLQMVPGEPHSGAAYFYDRRQQVFYLLCFDGADDNLTLEEFEHLLSEYNLLRYAEQPGLVESQPRMPEYVCDAPRPPALVTKEFDLSVRDCAYFTTKQGVRWYARPGLVQLNFQGAGSA
jgi:hypothetical protein